MKIPLSKGRAFALIDDEDFEAVSEHTWSFGHHGYAVKNRNGVALYMHRLILKTHFQVDHINRNKLDNRRSNLRVVDHVLNAQNSGPKKGKFKGVRWDKSRSKWMAGIMVRGEWFNLGRFNDAADAAKAYDEKARELCENPYLNFP